MFDIGTLPDRFPTRRMRRGFSCFIYSLTPVVIVPRAVPVLWSLGTLWRLWALWPLGTLVMRWGPLAVSMMVDAIANSMVGGMVGSHKVAMTVEGLCVTFSITMHSQAVVVVALKALGAPVGVTNPCGVHS